MKTLAPALLAASLLLVGINPFSNAQPSPAQTPNQSTGGQAAAQPKEGVTRPARIQIKNDYSVLSKEPKNLPDVPAFSGQAKYLGGFQTQKNGLSIGARYATQSSQQDVMTYYRTALKQYGWNMTGKENPHTLMAVHKNGNTIVLHVLPSGDPQMPTSFFLSFTMK